MLIGNFQTFLVLVLIRGVCACNVVFPDDNITCSTRPPAFGIYGNSVNLQGIAGDLYAYTRTAGGYFDIYGVNGVGSWGRIDYNAINGHGLTAFCTNCTGTCTSSVDTNAACRSGSYYISTTNGTVCVEFGESVRVDANNRPFNQMLPLVGPALLVTVNGITVNYTHGAVAMVESQLTGLMLYKAGNNLMFYSSCGPLFVRAGGVFTMVRSSISRGTFVNASLPAASTTATPLTTQSAFTIQEPTSETTTLATTTTTVTTTRATTQSAAATMPATAPGQASTATLPATSLTAMIALATVVAVPTSNNTMPIAIGAGVSILVCVPLAFLFGWLLGRRSRRASLPNAVAMEPLAPTEGRYGIAPSAAAPSSHYSQRAADFKAGLTSNAVNNYDVLSSAQLGVAPPGEQHTTERKTDRGSAPPTLHHGKSSTAKISTGYSVPVCAATQAAAVSHYEDVGGIGEQPSKPW